MSHLREWRILDRLGREWRLWMPWLEDVEWAELPRDLSADPEQPITALVDDAFHSGGASDDDLARQLLGVFDHLTGQRLQQEHPRPTNDPLRRLRGLKGRLARELRLAYETGVLQYARVNESASEWPIEEPPALPQPLAPSAEGTTFIGVRIVDQDGAPVAGRAVRIEPSGGGRRDSNTDVSGLLYLDGLTGGVCAVTLLDVDQRDVISPAAKSAGGGTRPGGTRTVREGETAASIATAAGFLWTDTVWLAPENTELRERRPDPNVLLAGDALHVPDRTPPGFSLPTGTEYTVTVRRTKLKVCVRLLDWLGAPRAGEPCTVSYGGQADVELTADDDGKITFEVPADVRTATIACNAGDQFVIAIGGLNPVDTLTGVGARMRNLGLCGAANDQADAALGDRLRLAFAVEIFSDLANTRPSKDTNQAFGDRIRKGYGL